ncbi:MAG: hypothetical protein WDW38_006019 [Sanguina aurantia]
MRDQDTGLSLGSMSEDDLEAQIQKLRKEQALRQQDKEGKLLQAEPSSPDPPQPCLSHQQQQQQPKQSVSQQQQQQQQPVQQQAKQSVSQQQQQQQPVQQQAKQSVSQQQQQQEKEEEVKGDKQEGGEKGAEAWGGPTYRRRGGRQPGRRRHAPVHAAAAAVGKPADARSHLTAGQAAAADAARAAAAAPAAAVPAAGPRQPGPTPGAGPSL